MNTMVVNCYAGPGAGKTTCAWEVASQLKKKGINTEYVSEYAKELVWEGKYDVLENQEHLFAEQAKRLERLRGKVEVIVTDSPILMSHIYGRNNSTDFTMRIDDEYKKYYNFNLFIKRGDTFQQAGRIQNLEESKALDRKIMNMLKEKNIYFGVYSHENVKYISDNIIKNLQAVREKPEIEIKATPTLKDAALYDKLYGKEIVKGYYITDSVTLNDDTFVMGYNPNAPQPYVTWLKSGDNSYSMGHYFDNELKAKCNLLERAEKNLDYVKDVFINNIESDISEGQAIEPKDYEFYKTLVSESKTDMNETEKYYCEAVNDPNRCMQTVEEKPWVIKYVGEQTPELCMAAVQNDGMALEYVREQTPELCMAAIQDNFRAICFVKEQTPELCMAAVQESAKALQYVKEQTPEMLITAMKHDIRAINYVSEDCANSLIDKVEKTIANGQAVDPVEYNVYKALTTECEEFNSEVDMNEDFEM